MFNKIQLVLILMLYCLTCNLTALEIDEKITLRILKTSTTKKTILINRGAEDGLEVGNHAKFYLSVGVVARGVVIKVSPTRSVWSVYRLVNAEYIRNDELMKLKISEPVKISKDDSRMVIKDDTDIRLGSTDPRDLGIPLAEGADDLQDEVLVTNNSQKNQALMEMELERMQVIASRQFEVFGTVSYSNYSSTAFADEVETEYPSEEGLIALVLGADYYFQDEKKWYSHFSLNFTLKYSVNDILNYQGASNGDNSVEYFFGAHWYPTTLPFFTFKFLPYISGYYSMGSIESTFITGSESSSERKLTATGSITAMSFGAGFKYYLTKGIGVRAEILYYQGTEEFDVDSNNQTWTRNRTGPLSMLALGYRW